VAANVEAGRATTVEADGAGYELAPEEILVATEFPEHLASGEDRGLTVVLDVELDDALVREGFARDIVRHVQTLRRDLDLDLTDRIRIAWATDDDALATAAEEHADYVRGETLADAMARGDADGGKEVKLSGRRIRLKVERA